MTQERIDIETMEARIRLWREGDISDEDLALEMDYMVPELKRCYEELDLAHRNLSIVRNALARGYPDIEEEIWELIDASE